MPVGDIKNQQFVIIIYYMYSIYGISTVFLSFFLLKILSGYQPTIHFLYSTLQKSFYTQIIFLLLSNSKSRYRPRRHHFHPLRRPSSHHHRLSRPRTPRKHLPKRLEKHPPSSPLQSARCRPRMGRPVRLPVDISSPPLHAHPRLRLSLDAVAAPKSGEVDGLFSL